jgi:hypothetical protein
MLRTADAAWRAAPVALRVAWILAVASCSGPVVIIVPATDGQGKPNMPSGDAASSVDAAASEASEGDQSDGSGGEQPDAGTPPPDAEDDTTLVAFEAGGNSPDAAPDAITISSVCVPAPNSDTLPFAVDSKYATSGYEGDAVSADAITLPRDTTCSGDRSTPGAVGACHTVVYTPLPYGQPIGNGTTAMGWAGVAWQYPADNWGTQPGYAIPAGAKSVTFSARGMAGGEVVSFWFGGSGSGASALCSDPLSGGIHIKLTTSWTTHSIPLNGPYAPAVLTAFGFSVSKSDQPAPAGALPVTFYVDDIRWKM